MSKRSSLRTNKTSSAFNWPYFKLKASESEKRSGEGQWYKDYMEHLIPYNNCKIDRYEEMKLAYDILNNNLEGFKEELDVFCNPLGEEGVEGLGFTDDNIVPFNKLFTKVSTLQGELLKRNDDFNIVLLSNNQIKDKNKQLQDELRKSVEESAEIVQEVAKMKAQGASEREIEQFVKENTTQQTPEEILNGDFLSQWELFNTKAIKYCKLDQDIKSKQQMTLKHSITADGCFLYVGWKHGKPCIEVVNNLHCSWHKSPNETRVEKGDYFYTKEAVTLGDIHTEYGNLLDSEELDRLTTYQYGMNLGVNPNHDVMGKRASLQFDRSNNYLHNYKGDHQISEVGHSTDDNDYGYNHNDYFITKVHLEFKAFKRVIFLSYMDEMGELIEDIADIEFEIPSDAIKSTGTSKWDNEVEVRTWVDEFGTEYRADILWIPRRYEVTRLGEDIYVDYREVPNQPLNLSNPYADFELSYKGMSFSNFNSKGQSLVTRAMAPYFQYLFIKKIQNRELSKYQGFTLDIDVDQIPDYLAMDSEGDPIPGRDKVAVWQVYLKRMGINYYSGSQSSDGLVPNTRSPGSKSSMTGTAIELINLAQIAEMIDREIGMAMGISPQRESNFSSNTNVTDNNNAIQMSYHITEPYFFMHSQVWKYAINDWLKLFRAYWQDKIETTNEAEHFLQYMAPNGSKELLKITPEILDNDDIGLFLTPSGNDETYRKHMLQLSHSFGQNAGEGMEAISQLLRSITNGDSAAEIHKNIQIEAQKQRERLARSEEAAMQAEKEAQQREIEYREDQQQHEKDIEHIRGGYGLQEKAVDVYKFQDDLNKDRDGIPDPLEAAKALHDMQMQAGGLAVNQQKLNIDHAKVINEQANKERELALKEKQANKPEKSIT